MVQCSCLHRWNSPQADQTSKTKKKRISLGVFMLSTTLFHCDGAHLVTCWLVGLFSKAQAEKRQRDRGQQGHRVEEGDGMQQSCRGKMARGFHTWGDDVYRNCGREGGARTYLIWARRRRAARTCRGWEPPSPGWWPLCGCAGWVWWGRTRSTCCIGRPCVWGSHRADLREEKNAQSSLRRRTGLSMTNTDIYNKVQ